MRIAFLSWRDFTHPEGGGAEHYVETVAAHLVGRGHEVSIFCAAHGDASAREVKNGVTYLRQGGRLTVYAKALRALRSDERRNGPYDVVVDSQNGIPFFSPWATHSPVVVLLHHVHREQWPVIFGPVAARIGWFIESKVAPPVYRRNQYVTVSARTKAELADLGVSADRIAVIHNGTDVPLAQDVERAAQPTLVVLGRLVPHKRIEQAIDVLARLRPTHPRLRLRIIGHGWWHDQIAAHAEASGVADGVALLGFVDEQAKHAELAASWVALAPSVKEGWGLCVVEAASHGVPTVAYREAGGLSESIIDGSTGVLVRDLDEMAGQVSRLLRDEAARSTMGARAREHAGQFTWESTAEYWEQLLEHVGRRGAPIAMTDARSQSVKG